MTRLFLSAPDVGQRERDLVMEAFDSNYVAPLGPMLERFEREFADYVGARHALAVSSGTAALHLALRMLGVGPGDAVIAPSLTFIGGVAPIAYQGATPVFVDADPVSWNLDTTLLDRAFDSAEAAGLKVKAVMPTDLYGQACDADAISAVCRQRGVSLIQDCAEGVGALYQGRPVGVLADCAGWSFNGNKIMTTSGGGMLTSDDGDLIARARYLSTAARQPAPYYEHTEVGFNYRLSNISAAIGLGQLESIEAKVARRRAIFARYVEQLADVPGLRFAPEAPDRRHTRWLTVALLDPEFGATPEETRQTLERDDIETRPLWKPMHLQPVFATAPRVGGRVSEDLFARGLCLPSGSAMSDADVDRVCQALRAVARRT